MVIEFREGRLRSLIKDPLAVARGKGVWSTLKEEYVIAMEDGDKTKNDFAQVTPLCPDTIMAEEGKIEIIKIGRHRHEIETYKSIKILSREDINDSDNLWHDEVRWRPE